MSPEVALLVRALLLGLLVFAIERFGRRRQERRAAARNASTIIRLPATPPVTGRPLPVEVVKVIAKPSITAPSQNEIVRLPRTAPAYSAEYRFDGHVTEKRAA